MPIENCEGRWGVEFLFNLRAVTGEKFSGIPAQLSTKAFIGQVASLRGKIVNQAHHSDRHSI